MKKLSIFALFLLLVLPLACQKETILEENTDNNELTIQEAKAWFETNIGKTSPNTRTAGAIAAFIAKEPLWQVATQATLKNGRTGWMIPLKMKQLRDLSYRSSTQKDIKPNSVQATPVQYLFQFKDKGKIQLQVVEYMPEKNYRDKNKQLILEKDFSGIVFVKTWEEKVIGGGHYLNGKRMSTFSPKLAGGRITATVCNDFARIYFSNGCITGSNGELTSYGHNEVVEGCASGYIVNPQSIPTPPGHYWCSGWTLSDVECFNVCYDVPDPDPNPIVFPGGGSAFAYLDVQLYELGEPQITDREKNILNNLPNSLEANVLYRTNALFAATQTRIRYNMNSNQCQDNECNSYKHALFNALNAKSFGVNIARQLGEAREGGRTLSSTNCSTEGAIYMDLVNNETGYSVYLLYEVFKDFPTFNLIIEQYIYTKAVSGQLHSNPGC